MLNKLEVNGITLENVKPPSYAKWIDKYLVKLGGLNPYKKPHLKLVWGCEQRRFYKGECDFHGVCAGMRITHLAATAVVKMGQSFNKETGVIETVFAHVDIGKPRWYLYEWWSPSLLAPGWDSEVLGLFPSQGAWRQVLTIETPDCKYRHPDKETMDWVAQMWQERQKARATHNADEPMPTTLLQWELEKQHALTLEAEEKKKQQLEDRFKSLLAPHVKRLMHNNPNKGRGY